MVAQTSMTLAADRLADCLARISAHNDVMKAMITVDGAGAERAMASLAETRSPLSGRVFSLKDNIAAAGLACTCGSAYFRRYVAEDDAIVVQRLRRSGAVIVGKDNMHEFAFGATTQNPTFGACLNAWDISRLPGGSSGGSAVSVAMGFCEIALGTDTGGSVRIPAALNGVTSLRPTVGRVPNTGVVPLSESFDTIGPIARNAIDMGDAYEVIAGFHPSDPMSADLPVENWRLAYARGMAGTSIGVLSDFMRAEASQPVQRCVEEAVDVFLGLGAVSSSVELPGIADIRLSLMVCLQADAAANHMHKLEEAPNMIGTDVAERLRLGASRTAVDYSMALKAIREWRAAMDSVFQSRDLLIVPTVGFIAPSRDQTPNMIQATHRLTRFTAPWSAAKLPAVSVPCGFVDGLPVGMQIVGPRWSEAKLITAAVAFQSVTDHHRQVPSCVRP